MNCRVNGKRSTRNLQSGMTEGRGMDYEEFYRGWLLLIAQPWGKQYQDRQGMTDEQRMTVRIQQELYYKRLAHCNPYLWESIAESYAAGDHWPTIDELKRTIAQNSPQPTQEQLVEPDWKSAPEPLAIVMAHHKRESVTIREAALAVLPGWLQKNPSHSDAEDARLFLASAESFFGIKQKPGRRAA